MKRAKPLLGLALLVGAVVVAILVAARVRESRRVVLDTVDDIKSELADLDPVERAAVIAKLSADAARDIKAKRA